MMYRRFFICFLLSLSLLGASFAQPKQQIQLKNASLGTGFFVADGILITAHHVVANKSQIFIGSTSAPMTITKAELIASDSDLDLAILKSAHKGVPLTFSDWSALPIGLEIAVLGFPQPRPGGINLKITNGIINGSHSRGSKNDWFQLSAEIHKGNSGGPVIAPDGRVVGVVTHKLDAMKQVEKNRDLPQNVNYAVRSDRVLSFLRASGIEFRSGELDLKLSFRPYEIYARFSGQIVPVLASNPPDQ